MDYLKSMRYLFLSVLADKEEIASKGHWQDNKTFVIEHHVIGDPTKQIFEFSFNDNNVEINVSTFGLNAVIKGIVKNKSFLT